MKIALFVEGLTELEFSKYLIKSICGNREIDVEIKEQLGGKLVSVSFTPGNGATTYVLIVNCNNDAQVKTQIRDQYPSLVSAGYTYIIGLRDIYPDSLAELPKYQASLYTGLPNTPQIPIELHIAILEVEAWFLDETTHFARIDKSLTIPAIKASGFAIDTTMGKDWRDPAKTLDKIYKLAGKRYKKKKKQINRTVNSLSPDELYVTVRNRAPSFDGFVQSLENALF